MLVPAYFHPAVAPAEWAALTALTGHSVNLNVASGPGAEPSEPFTTVAGRLRAAGVRLLGYLDEAYGTRAPAELLAEAAAYREWYAVDGVFLDRAPADPGHLPAHRSLIAQLRTTQVVANHGVYPVAGYAAGVDVLVVFEGPYAAYREVRVPGWARAMAAERFCHLVYDVPAAAVPDVRERAAACHAGVLYATDRGGVNPYDGLSAYVAELIGGHGTLTG